MNDPRNMTVETMIVLPFGGGSILVKQDILHHEARCFTPLPSGRDLPGPFYDFQAMAEAKRMEEERHKWAKRVGQMITHHILKAVESKDPQLGYRPDPQPKIEIKRISEEEWMMELK